MRYFLMVLLLLPFYLMAQADNEIQVYASPTIQHGWTIFELHSNYTPRGNKLPGNGRDARRWNETLEITHGLGKNMELGFYTFTSFIPGGGYQYQGNQVRPRVTVPQEWKWPVGASLSVEFGFFRPHRDSSFLWQGEVRPIIDLTSGPWYFSFNPNVEFTLSGPDQGSGIAPQFKAVHTFGKKLGVGLEYYGSLGSFRKILPGRQQEHLLGPMLDLYVHPMWELNGGLLFGLTDASDQRIVKLLLGRRIGK